MVSKFQVRPMCPRSSGAGSTDASTTPGEPAAPTMAFAPGLPPIMVPDFASLSEADMTQAKNAALDITVNSHNPSESGTAAAPASYQALTDNQKAYADFMANRIQNTLQLPHDWSMQPPGGFQVPSATDVSASSGAGSTDASTTPGEPAAPTMAFAPGLPPIMVPDFASLSEADMTQAKNAALDITVNSHNPSESGTAAAPASYQALTDNQKAYADFMANRIQNTLQLPHDWSMQPPGGFQVPSATDVSASSGAGSTDASTTPGEPAAPTMAFAPGLPPIMVPDFASLSEADMTQAKNAALDITVNSHNPSESGTAAAPASYQALTDNQKAYADFMANRIQNTLQLPHDWSMQPPGGQSPPSRAN